MGALALSALAASPAHAESHPTVPSSFISAKLTVGWDSTRWGYEFRDLKAAGISELVLDGAVFATGDRPTAYYPSGVPGVDRASGPAGAPADVITPLLSGARSAGMHVWLGTYIPDSGWYAPNDATVDEMTTSNAAITAAVLKDLDAKYSAYSDVVSGWYLGSEVSASYAWSWNAGTALTDYYRSLAATAKAARTATRTMIAPYFNIASLPPHSSLWTSMWTRILSAAPIDVLALQDGTGDTGIRLPPETVRDQLLEKFGDTRAAITASGAKTELWADLDLYDTEGLKSIADVAAVTAILSGTVSRFTSWSFSQLYSPWTLGTDMYAAPFGSWNNTGVIPVGAP